MSERVRRELDRAGVEALVDEDAVVWMEVLLRRVNQAKVALGDEPLSAIPEESCEPDSACNCVLGTHLHVQAMYESVRFRVPSDAEKVAAAWETEQNVDGRVKLPDDLRLATSAFDHGLLPDLIDPERWWESGSPTPADLSEVERIRRNLTDWAEQHGVR